MLKRILCALAVMLMVMTFSAGSAYADDMPYGYSVVDETPGKGETSRSKILNKEKELVGRKIVRADGTNEMQSFKNTVLTQKIVYAKDGSRLGEFYYYPDGKLKRELEKGVLRFERRKLADGTFEAIRYKTDGKSPQMRRRVGADGAFELTHYRTGKSNSVYFSATIKGASGNFEWQYFAEDGSHLRRVVGDKEMVVTVYDKVGNFKLEQVWTKNTDGTYAIKSVASPSNTGCRRYNVDAKGVVTNVEDIDSDGSVPHTWSAAHADKPDASLLKEQFEDDDPTIPNGEQ